MKSLFEQLLSLSQQYKKEVMIVAVGLLVFFLLFVTLREKGERQPAIYVKVTQPVIKSMVSEISTSGTIKAKKEITLSSKIPGKVQRIPASAGATVSKDQLLIELESKELEIKTEIAEKAHRSAASAIDEENFKRHKVLYEEGVITKSEFDKLKSQHEAAKADKERLEKTVALQKEHRSSAHIRAPFDALLAKTLVNEGEVINAGQPLAILVNMDSIEVEVPIASKNIQSVKIGQKTSVVVDSSKKIFTGRIDHIEQVADPISRTFNTKILVVNEKHILKPGMFAKVSIETRRNPSALTIPKAALVKKEGLAGKWIYVIDNENSAHLKQIKTGLETATDIEVVSGLTAKEKVVVAGQSQLYDQAPVSILNPRHEAH